jgi:hypothetical protein
MHAAQSRHDDERAAQVRGLAARLAEDRFQLAVMGQFSRGQEHAHECHPRWPLPAHRGTADDLGHTERGLRQPCAGNGRERWRPAPARKSPSCAASRTR